MAIDWSAPLCTGHGTPLVAQVLDGMSPSGLRRISLASLSQRDGQKQPTTWFYRDDGRRPDCNDPKFNLVNFDPADNVIRTRIVGR